MSGLGALVHRGYKPHKREEVTAAVCASPDTTLVTVDGRGHVFYFRCDMVPLASAEGKKGQTLKRGVGIVGFTSSAELAGQRVYALTARGRVHALALPPAHKLPRLTSTPHAALPLSEDDQVAAVMTGDPASFG